MSQTPAISVLLIEDNTDHAQCVQVCLRQFKEIPFEVIRATGVDSPPQKTVDSRARNMNFEVTWVTSHALALAQIAECHFDIVLLDWTLPDSQSLPAIRSIKQAVDPVPIIALLEAEDAHVGQTLLKAGAKGHIVKNDTGYGGLVRLIRYVLHRADIETRNQLLVAALEATSNAIIITDRDARIEWINPGFTQLTGYSFQEALGRKPSELLKSGAHDESFYELMWQKLAEGDHWQGEIVNRHKDGSFYNAEVGISPVRNKNNSLTGYVQIQRDITDSVVRLAISAVLQQPLPLEQRFVEVLDMLFKLKSFDLQRKGGVFLKNKDENQLRMFVLNGEFTQEFIDKEQTVQCGSCLCGRSALSGKLLISDDCFCDPRHEHQFANMQAHGHYIVPLASGGEVLGVMFLYTEPYPPHSESRLATLLQVGEMMALAIHQQEAKTALETARDLAMRAATIKSEFLANMSHEIRTPMNGVLGMLDLLRETELTPTQRDWVETAHNSAEALLDIINDILDFSKLEAGKFDVETVEFNLVELVDDLCALLAVRAHAKGLELNCALPVQMNPRWQGDPMRIRQVLTNLLGNAIKFTEHGEVNVNVICLGTVEQPQGLRLEVHDTGIGIAPETQTTLFKPFSQADSATSRRFGGSGLGLSICKKLVELMGGTIGVSSVLGEGSCFWFELPLKAVPWTHNLMPNYEFSGQRVLIVDDNATNRSILANYLRSWGLSTLEVENGSIALTTLQTASLNGAGFDLLLLDVQMPIMDGLTLAKCLFQINNLSNTPIILISSGDQIHQADYKNTAVVQRLLKPVRQSQLFDVVATALHKQQRTHNKTAKPETPFPQYPNKRVLVVEDNKINQKVLLAKLGKYGLNPDVAENGEAALAKLTQCRYDLIFMDCQMPVMDGYEATRHLRIFERQQGIPHQYVVALTANAMEGEREKCLTAGMDDYLTKPLVSEQLSEFLATRLATVPVGHEEKDDADARAVTWNDKQTLAQLEGDQQLLAEMLALFAEEAPQQLAALATAHAAEDWQRVAQTAHALKGALSLFYADVAVKYASQLESAANNGELAVLADYIDALTAAVSELLEDMARH